MLVITWGYISSRNPEKRRTKIKARAGRVLDERWEDSLLDGVKRNLE